jgi:endoglucanase
MTGGKPDYTLSPLFLQFLDEAVSWAEELEIYLIIDNHSTDDIASKNPDLENVLLKVWRQMAEHYKDRSECIVYELLNEPNGSITTSRWGIIQQKTIDAIRGIDKRHTLMVGAADFNSYDELKLLPTYSDTNLIYTFHFYDPFLFTHQGVGWLDVPFNVAVGIPFPYDSETMPQMPEVLKDTWVKYSYSNYPSDGTVQNIKSLINIARDFKSSRNVDVFCGEFGVYRPFADTTDRAYWYSEVRKYLEECGIPWTIWDYQGGFGLFNQGSNEMFDYDMNIPVARALGFSVPEQLEYVLLPASVGFSMYSDFIGEKITDVSYALNGTIKFYSTDKPNNGNNCIFWTGSDQYAAIAFNFVPDKDLSKLVGVNYALSLMIRSDAPGTKIEVRFIDSKKNAEDHPWRMNFTIDESICKWDKKWHKVYIPLNKFIDMGSWDNAWYNPAGAFDWSIVDRFEITTDQGSLKNKSFWFDNIAVSNQDTALVYDNSAFEQSSSVFINKSENYNCKVYPLNVNSTSINYTLDHDGKVKIEIYDIMGRKVKLLENGSELKGSHQIIWNHNNNEGEKVANGIYICNLLFQNWSYSAKIMVIK